MNHKTIRLTITEKADVCMHAVIAGSFLIMFGLFVASIMGYRLPFEMRVAFIVVGAFPYNYGLWRLHKAASGNRSFTDGTVTRLDRWRSGGSARVD